MDACRWIGVGRYDMGWYFYIAWAAIVAQLLYLYNAARNYHYALSRYAARQRPGYQPRVALIVPCKGLDARFQLNTGSLLRQDYDHYRLFFVVEDSSDPAYAALCEAKETFGRDSKAQDVQILVAGPSTSCSQKIHNLLYAIGCVPDDTEALAFADSDVCVPSDWLCHLVRPLKRDKYGLTTGYRWFIPAQRNLPTFAMSAMNAAIAQLLGNTRFNLAWGGSMAMRAEDFRRLKVSEIWQNTLSDDLSLNRIVRRAGLAVRFVPTCLVPSFAATTWPDLYEFARRQFLITRVYAPGSWWLGFLSSLGSVAGLWGGLVLAAWAAANHAEYISLYGAVPVVFGAGLIFRATLRQLMAVRILGEYLPQLAPAAIADIVGCWLWSVLLFVFILSSAFGRTIRWRGIRYRLISPTRTQVLGA